MMVYNTQKYWYFGLRPSSGILETRKHTVSKIRSATNHRWGGGRLRLALSKGPKRVGVVPSHLMMETDPVSETVCFLVSRIPDYGRSPKTQ
jgi:hypothetical protein